VVVKNRRRPSEIDRRAKRMPRENGGPQLAQTRKEAVEDIRSSFANRESDASRAAMRPREGPDSVGLAVTQTDGPRHLR
jgi:hypothetical protein